jgi:hypothetical protein
MKQLKLPDREGLLIIRTGDLLDGVVIASADLPSMLAAVPAQEGYRDMLVTNDMASILYEGNPLWVQNIRSRLEYIDDEDTQQRPS